MLLLLALFIGTLAACGSWLLLRERSFDAVLGLTLISYAVNLFILASGRVRINAVAIVAPELSGAPSGTVATSLAASLANTTDPLPQALVLTAIVISLAMTALALAMALRTHLETGSDHVDGEEPR